MPKRRSRGEGTIYQRPDGLWCAQIVLPDGKRKTKYGKIQAEVRDWLAAQRQQITSGSWTSGKEIQLSEFLDRYLADVAANRVKPQTLRLYQDAARFRILPYIGSLKLAAIQPHHIQRLYTQLSAKGLAPGSILIAHGVLRQALSQALAWNLISRNPSALVKPPVRKNDPPQMLRLDELARLRAGTADHWLGTLITLAVTTGLRRGELMGLGWDDLDLEARLLHVRQAVVAVKGEVKLVEPKTRTGTRTISIPPIAVSSLIHHRENFPRRKNLFNLVFPNRWGAPTNPNTINKLWDKKLAELGIPHVTFHSLRHLHATLLMEADISAKVVQERLGHSNVSVTLGTYSHVTQHLERGASDAIEKRLSASPDSSSTA